MHMYGMPALIEYQGLRPNLDLCNELGLDFVELNANMPYSFPEKIFPRELWKAMDGGMRFSIHLHDELDLGSLHPSVRLGHLMRCIDTIRWGSENGVWLINLHLNPGIYFTLPDKKVWVYERYLDQYISALRDSLLRLSNEAADHDIKICLENTGNLTMPFMRTALESCLDLKGVGLCWDIGHDARTNFQEEDFMLSYLDKVWHMHFHDYDGRSDHQLPFTGHINCPRFLRLAEDRDMSVLVEVKTEKALRQAVSSMRERGWMSSTRSGR
jgi:sugar phosphate isomerase/epimerase